MTELGFKSGQLDSHFLTVRESADNWSKVTYLVSDRTGICIPGSLSLEPVL